MLKQFGSLAVINGIIFRIGEIRLLIVLSEVTFRIGLLQLPGQALEWRFLENIIFLLKMELLLPQPP
jgi:hypothetical protein